MFVYQINATWRHVERGCVACVNFACVLAIDFDDFSVFDGI